jgi:DmsE family decaheme c-type cytochrome
VSLPERAEAQYTQDGSEGCLSCHGADRMTLIAATPHGDTNNPDAPFALQGCESCHGPGSLHVSRARGGTGLPALLRFGDRTTRTQQTAACLECHAQDMGGTKGMKWAGSLHDTPRITCVTCHVVHAEENSLADQSKQTAKCARCHKEKITNHKGFGQAGSRFEKLSCYDCHDVHQLPPAEPEPASEN